MELLIILIVGWIAYAIIKHRIKSLPDKARAKQRRKEWVETIEPALRNARGYPQDWIWRRKEVFLRANGRCELCGKEAGRLEEASRSGVKFVEPLLKGAHVHHTRKVSDGGDHFLSNLQLLCEPCHALKHPNRNISGMISRGLTRRVRGTGKQIQ